MAKFLAASHYGYNTLKMPGPIAIISINSSKKDAVICMDKLYMDVVTVETGKAIAPAKSKNSKKWQDIQRGLREARLVGVLHTH